jgi:hypothetical protein
VIYRDANTAEQKGIQISRTRAAGTTNFDIYNNTFHDLNFGVYIQMDEMDNNVNDVNIKNNVFTGTGTGVQFAKASNAVITNVAVTHNVKNGTGNLIADSQLVTGFTNLENSTTTAGLKLTGNKPAPFFEVSSGTSYVVNRGTTSNLPSEVGTVTPEIGAYFWGAPIGFRVAFKSSISGRYTTANASDSYILTSNSATVIGTAEKYDVVDAGSGFIGLKSVASGKFASANINNGNKVQASFATTPSGDWEKFTWEDRSNGVIALKSKITGKYVSVNQNNGSRWDAGFATSVGTWEPFTWRTAP